MAPHSSTLAWKIPWTEKPGRLQSMGSLRVEHHWATSLSLFTFMHWRRKWQPTPVFLPGESQGWGSLVGCYWVAQSRTRLKWLSSSSSRAFLRFIKRNWLLEKSNPTLEQHWKVDCLHQNEMLLHHQGILKITYSLFVMLLWKRKMSWWTKTMGK